MLSDEHIKMGIKLYVSQLAGQRQGVDPRIVRKAIKAFIDQGFNPPSPEECEVDYLPGDLETVYSDPNVEYVGGHSAFDKNGKFLGFIGLDIHVVGHRVAVGVRAKIPKASPASSKFAQCYAYANECEDFKQYIGR